MAGFKRDPENFPHEGRGGAFDRFEKLSKADWADAYADLYRQVFGENAPIEDVLADAERRDDLRRYRDGGKPARHPRPATDAEKRKFHTTIEERRRQREEWAAAHPYDHI